MFIVLGANGHVGGAVADTLLERGEPVTVVLHDGTAAARWRAKGAQVVTADVHDADALRAVFRRARRAFLLNPPAAPSTDTDAVERGTVRCLLQALDDSGLQGVVAASTMGAQPGAHLGDLGVLFELEQALASQPIPWCALRSAYYLSNWDAALKPARDDGVLPTMFPADFRMPMVAPRDAGRHAAELLAASPAPTGIRYVEGPARYDANEVAAAFATALGRPVRASATPPERHEAAFRALGFSEPAARSYARMTAVIADSRFVLPEEPLRGGTTLQAYVDALAGSA